MPAVKSIAVINQKGGVGKTTSVANLGAAFAARARSVCLVDMDPQSHLTLHFGLEPGASAHSTYDMLAGEVGIVQAAIGVRENLSLVPSVIDLAAAEVELAGTVGREQILREQLGQAHAAYEYVLIDCPPSLSLLTLNALAAADDVVIPLQPHFLALQGLGKLLETISLVRERINPVLRVAGVILCIYDSTTRLTAEVVADLARFFEQSRNQSNPWSQAVIFRGVIRRNIKLAECPSHGKTIFEYAPSSHGAADYDALAEELLAYFQPVGPPHVEAGPSAHEPVRSVTSGDGATDGTGRADGPE